MIINNSNKTKLKILLDTEDLKNAKISLKNWVVSPYENINKLLIGISEYKNIDIKRN